MGLEEELGDKLDDLTGKTGERRFIIGGLLFIVLIFVLFALGHRFC